MTVKEFYQEIRGDYDEMRRRIPSDSLILRFLKQFPSDNSYRELINTLQKQDISCCFLAAHKFKGLVANMSFNELYSAINDLTEQLRPQTQPADAELVQRVTESYEMIIHKINRLSDGERQS